MSDTKAERRKRPLREELRAYDIACRLAKLGLRRPRIEEVTGSTKYATERMYAQVCGQSSTPGPGVTGPKPFRKPECASAATFVLLRYRSMIAQMDGQASLLDRAEAFAECLAAYQRLVGSLPARPGGDQVLPADQALLALNLDGNVLGLTRCSDCRGIYLDSAESTWMSHAKRPLAFGDDDHPVVERPRCPHCRTGVRIATPPARAAAPVGSQPPRASGGVGTGTLPDAAAAASPVSAKPTRRAATQNSRRVVRTPIALRREPARRGEPLESPARLTVVV